MDIDTDDSRQAVRAALEAKRAQAGQALAALDRLPPGLPGRWRLDPAPALVVQVDGYRDFAAWMEALYDLGAHPQRPTHLQDGTHAVHRYTLGGAALAVMVPLDAAAPRPAPAARPDPFTRFVETLDFAGLDAPEG